MLLHVVDKYTLASGPKGFVSGHIINLKENV